MIKPRIELHKLFEKSKLIIVHIYKVMTYHLYIDFKFIIPAFNT